MPGGPNNPTNGRYAARQSPYGNQGYRAGLNYLQTAAGPRSINNPARDQIEEAYTQPIQYFKGLASSNMVGAAENQEGIKAWISQFQPSAKVPSPQGTIPTSMPWDQEPG